MALRKRGYTRTFLRKAQKTFLEVKERDHGPKLALVTNYSTQSKIANARIKQNYENRANGLLPEYKIISAYRKNKNLKDYLVRSRLKDTGQITRKDPDFFEQKEREKRLVRQGEKNDGKDRKSSRFWPAVLGDPLVLRGYKL